MLTGKKLVFEGSMYVKPLDRGVDLTTKDGTEFSFESWLERELNLNIDDSRRNLRVHLTLELLD